jgi:hypothetical protein
MSKLFCGIFLMILSTINLKVLKTKTKCMNLGDNCDLTSYCCDKWVCKDYRCAVKGTKDNQVEWAPKGTKCDYFHHCPKYYHCESHYCVVSRNKVVNAISKSLKRDY